MAYSLDTLTAFVEAAALGSFSAAARKLGKSQSTISEAIANLEIDLGVALFERSGRQPVLTAAGHALLVQARGVLSASEKLGRLASRLAGGHEPRLTLALSDTFQSEEWESTLAEIDQRYPDMEFECLISEDADVVVTVQRGRAHLGLLAARPSYPPDLASATLPDLSEMVMVAGAAHPLAKLADVTEEDIYAARELRIALYESPQEGPTHSSRCWSAPSYLMLLEMAVAGFGWTRMPRWMITRFAPPGSVVELKVAGWPKRIAVDALWSNQKALGPAGSWLLDRVLKR